MYQFLETICIENYEIMHLDLHLDRIQRTCIEYYGQSKNVEELRSYFALVAKSTKEKTKLSIWYNLTHQYFTTTVYNIIHKEKICWIENNAIDYHLKYLDRQLFEKYEREVGHDNACIIIQQHRPTDATYANLAFWNGEEWHTPTKALLKGINRNYLLSLNKIKEKDILMNELTQYTKISFINAMLNLGEMEIIL